MAQSMCDDRPVTTTVLEAIAEAENCDPTDLDELHAAIDPDALEALFGDGTTSRLREGRLSFVYSGYRVTVSSDGVVDLGEPAR